MCNDQILPYMYLIRFESFPVGAQRVGGGTPRGVGGMPPAPSPAVQRRGNIGSTTPIANTPLSRVNSYSHLAQNTEATRQTIADLVSQIRM